MPKLLQEADLAKKRQDEQLDRIGNGVGRLGEIARNMNEEVRSKLRPQILNSTIPPPVFSRLNTTAYFPHDCHVLCSSSVKAYAVWP